MALGTYQLVKILPVILGHETESWEKRPTEGVETRVTIVGIWAETLQTRVVRRAHTAIEWEFKWRHDISHAIYFLSWLLH